MRTQDKQKIYNTLKEARQVNYTLDPIRCPKCKHVGEVTYNQGVDYFYCAWCGAEFKGKRGL